MSDQLMMREANGRSWLAGRHTQSVRGRFRYSTVWPQFSWLPIRHVYHLRVAGQWLRVPHLAWTLFSPAR